MTTSDALEQAALWVEEGREVALATVISTWGSAPRPAGSHLAICDDSRFVGSVSGGCVEGNVIQEGLDAIDDGEARMLEFGISNSQAWEAGLACGGKIRIYVEKIG